MPPFSWDLDEPIVDCRGVPFIKNTQILTFNFHPSWPLGWIKKYYETKSFPTSNFSRLHFNEKSKFQNFGRLWLASLSGPLFLGRQPKNNSSTPNILLASSSCFQKGIAWPFWSKTLGGEKDTTVLFRLSSTCKKLLARSSGDPEPFILICPLGEKFWHFSARMDKSTFGMINDRHIREFCNQY